jgi:hypothetical protein
VLLEARYATARLELLVGHGDARGHLHEAAEFVLGWKLGREVHGVALDEGNRLGDQELALVGAELGDRPEGGHLGVTAVRSARSNARRINAPSTAVFIMNDPPKNRALGIRKRPGSRPQFGLANEQVGRAYRAGTPREESLRYVRRSIEGGER